LHPGDAISHPAESLPPGPDRIRRDGQSRDRRKIIMAHYLVRARPRLGKLEELQAQLRADAYVDLQPFGRALTRGLRGARIEGDGAVWEEEDYCSPPLAEERAAVLDAHFESITVERVAPGEGWQRIETLPPLFPDLERTS
jgi:hypothetical protein